MYSKFIILSWKRALILFIKLFIKKYKENLEVICGSYLSLELGITLKSFFNSIGFSNIVYWENNVNLIDFRYSYLMNITIQKISTINNLMLIGTNPRLELPLLNSFLRKNYLTNTKFKAYSIGFALDFLSFPVINLGSSIKYFFSFLMGFVLVSRYFLLNTFYNNYFFNGLNLLNLTFFIGNTTFCRSDSDSILNSIFYFSSKLGLLIKNINIISRHLGRLTHFELGLSSSVISLDSLNKKGSFIFLLGIDNITKVLNKKYKNFQVFQGFFYILNLFKNVNLVLPTSIYSEKVSSYINLEGRLRVTNIAVIPSQFIFLDSKIIESISILSKNLNFYNFSIFKNFYIVVSFFKVLFNFFLNYLNNLKKNLIIFLNDIVMFSQNYSIIFFSIFCFQKLSNTLLNKVIYNFYSNDIFSKMSKSMGIFSQKNKILNFINSYA